MANDMSKKDKYCKISLVCESEKGKLIEKNVAFRGCRKGKTEVLPKGTNVQLQDKKF